MIKQIAKLNRRKFFRFVTRVALVLSLTGASALVLYGCGASRSLSAQSPAAGSSPISPVAWNVSLVGPSEPGEPMIISGTIYAPDGRTPLEGISLFVYQTDATGRYSTSGGDNRNTRLHGVMQTNREGRYEFRTIKPASYPNSRIAAHVHAYVSGPGYPEYWIDEYHFADDPFVTSEMKAKDEGKGNRSSIVTLTRGADGTLRGARDIVVERCSKNCTGH
jgi:protocatechuate 3,4-dioxygenase beta subunit